MEQFVLDSAIRLNLMVQQFNFCLAVQEDGFPMTGFTERNNEFRMVDQHFSGDVFAIAKLLKEMDHIIAHLHEFALGVLV
ncbi:hypothetical protein D3C80_19500 [compost metagenome]